MNKPKDTPIIMIKHELTVIKVAIAMKYHAIANVRTILMRLLSNIRQ